MMKVGFICYISFVTFHSFVHLFDYFVTASTGNYDDTLLTHLKEYNYEIAQLLVLSEGNNSRFVVIDFLQYMVEKLDEIHSVNRPAPPAQEIPSTYNPPLQE